MSGADVDLVVVGGGIHGVGVAQAAAAAGYSCLLLEERELAAGTSRRSSKLIHGGLRYLESAQLGLVRESLRERELLLRNAPGLVRLVPFNIPVYRDTSRPPWKIRAGLTLYALLGGLDRDDRFESLPRERWGELDGLTTLDLRAVFRYFDGQTDDAALTRAVMASARSLGAELAVPARFLGAARRELGWSVRYDHEGAERRVECAALVNAAGPWIEEVRALLEPAPPAVPVDLVQGTHIELAGELRQGVYYTEARHDRRAVFTMPWHGRVLVGTTETVFRGDPAQARPLEVEVEYLRAVHARHFPDAPNQALDAWAGLRVLPSGGGAAFGRPRETIYGLDDPHQPRMVGLYGGKLTGYRATAEHTLSLLRNALPVRPRRADTRRLPLAPEA